VQAADLASASSSPHDLRLCIELPVFPHAVLYQQLPTLAAVAAATAKKDGAAAAAVGGSAAAMGAAPLGAAGMVGGGGGGGPGMDGDGGSLDTLVVIADSEVSPLLGWGGVGWGWGGPAEVLVVRVGRWLILGSHIQLPINHTPQPPATLVHPNHHPPATLVHPNHHPPPTNHSPPIHHATNATPTPIRWGARTRLSSRLPSWRAA